MVFMPSRRVGGCNLSGHLLSMKSKLTVIAMLVFISRRIKLNTLRTLFIFKIYMTVSIKFLFSTTQYISKLRCKTNFTMMHDKNNVQVLY